MIRAWVADASGARAATTEEALGLVSQGAGAVWIDIDSDDEADVRRVLEPLRVHPLVLEDVMTHVHRPKVDNYGPYLYLVFHSARWDEDRPRKRPAR